MKSLRIMVSMGLLVFLMAACAKTELAREEVNTPNVSAFYVDMKTNSVTTISLSDLSSSSELLTSLRANKSTNGHYTIETARASFSAMVNSDGTSGEGHYANGPRFVRSASWITSCLVVVNNQAYMGGVLTQISIDPTQGPPPLAAVGPGWSMYQAVEDNGQGANADPDKLFPGFLFVPPVDHNGDPIPPICELFYQLTTDLQIPFVPGDKPTNIKVK